MFPNQNLMRAIIADSKLNLKATDILSDPNTDEVVIARLSQLTLCALLTCADEAPQECGYLYHLLKYVANHTVFNTFMVLFGEDEKLEKPQRWLADFGIIEYVLRELATIDYEHVLEPGVDPYYEPVFYKAHCIYLMIAKASTHHIFGPELRKAETVTYLHSFFKVPPPYVKNSYWKALNNLCCEKNVNDMKSFAGHALAVLEEQNSKLYEYQVTVILFLEKLMRHIEEIATQLCESSITAWLVQMLLCYKESSILHSAFRTFFVTAMKHEPIIVNFINVYITAIIAEAMHCENKVLMPTLMFIIEKIKELENKNTKYTVIINSIPDYKEFCKKQLKEYQRVSTSSYGGRRPNSIAAFFSQLIG